MGFLEVGAAGPRLWLHSLDSSQSRALPGLDFKTRAGPSFWSPDSRWLGIWIDNKIKRVDLSGGPAETLADAANFGGGTWGTDNVILFADLAVGVMRVPASGGTPAKVTSVDASRQESAHLLPSFLPDGRHFLYLRLSTTPAVSGIYIGRVDASPEQQDLTRLLATGSQAVYASANGSDNGYLLFLREGLLTAQPFNARTRTLTGDAAPVLDEPIAVEGGFGMYSASDNGTLVYRAAVSGSGTLVAVNRSGQRETLLGGATLDRAANPRLSPDGRRLALILGGDLWSYDLEGRPPIKLTFDGNKFSPLWTPDGTRTVYEQGGSKGPVSLFAVPADGSGGPAQPVAPEGHYHPHGWTATGDLVVVRLAGGDFDLFRFAPRPDGKPEVVQANEGLSGSVSPDGRWVAYTADPTGRSEIWVRPVPGPGAAVRVSPNGGNEPVWARNGRELYYLEGDKMMAVGLGLGAAFNFKPAVELFKAAVAVGGQPPSYDVMPDGRFIFVTPDETRDVPISVILNWSELLRNRAAAQ